MARPKTKLGTAVYFVRRIATHFKTGKMSEASFGPFPTCQEAQVKLDEDKEAAVAGIPEYEYEYRIEIIPVEALSQTE